MEGTEVQEKLRVSAQARLDQILEETDKKRQTRQLEYFKIKYAPFAYLVDEVEKPKLLPRTQNADQNKILENCEKALEGVDSATKNIFLKVAQQAIAKSIAPLTESEKRKLPPEKRDLDPVEARQILFKKETQEAQEEPKETLPKGLKRSDFHTRPKEPARWIIEGVLPEGLTFLGAKAFGGKSLLSALLVENLIRGEKFLGKFDSKVSDVLYFDWEKVESEILNRTESIAPIMDDSIKGEATYFAIDTPGQPRNQEEFIKFCDAYLDQNPNIKVIVIDTLPRITSEKTGGDSEYNWETKNLGALQNWAKVRRVALIALLHTTKYFNEKASNPFDAFLGGAGLQGVADCCWLLLRTKGHNDPFGALLTQCKIGGANYSLELTLNGAKWELLGDLNREQAPKTTRTTRVKKEEVEPENKPKTEEPKEPEKLKSDIKQKVIRVLKKGPCTPKEIAEKMGDTSEVNQTRIRKLLMRMKKSGEICQKEPLGPYSL